MSLVKRSNVVVSRSDDVTSEGRNVEAREALIYYSYHVIHTIPYHTALTSAGI